MCLLVKACNGRGVDAAPFLLRWCWLSLGGGAGSTHSRSLALQIWGYLRRSEVNFCFMPAQIFAELAKVGRQCVELDERGEAVQHMPFHIIEPHPGLRAYPFLSQARSPAVLL